MSAAAAVVAVVLLVLFLIGVGVGILVVTAVSARRADRAVRQVRPAAAGQGTWPQLPTTASGSGSDAPGWWHGRGNDLPIRSAGAGAGRGPDARQF